MARKVTIFINSLTQGGAERQAQELVQALDRNRYEPSLITCTGEDQLRYGLEVPRRRISSPFALNELRQAMAELGTEVLHSYLGLANLGARLGGHRGGAKAVVTSVRNTNLPWYFILSDRLTHRHHDALIVNSRGIREELERRAGLPSATIDVVENGVDTQRFSPQEASERNAARSELGWAGQRILLVPGRLSWQKNQLGILRAVRSLVAQQRWPSDVRILFAGRGSPPWVGQVIRSFAKRAVPGDEVRWVGVVPDLQRWLPAADAMLLPSHHEGLPNAVLEAMACGVPAIVSPAANVDGLVREGLEGLVTPGATPRAIEETLLRYFALPEAARMSMGQLGRERALSEYSVARLAERTMAVYDRVLAREAT